MLSTNDFNPLALGMLKRWSPATVEAAFGPTAARQIAAIPMRDALEQACGGRAPSFADSLTRDDLTNLLGDTIGAAAITAYATARPEIMQVSAETQAIDDFRPQERHRGDIFPTLLETAEGSEVRFGTVEGRAEIYAAKRFSRRIEISEESIVNDSLGLVAQSGAAIGEAVADVKASVLAGLLADNPTMADGTSVFDSTRGNDLTQDVGETAADPAQIFRAVTAMRRQKHMDGARPISVRPAFIVVPPELEMQARKSVATLTPAAASDVNPVASLGLEVIVEPRLTDPDAYYVMAAPGNRLTLEHGTVNRTADPEIRTESPLERHVVATRVTTDFGGGWIDFRGAVRITTS